MKRARLAALLLLGACSREAPAPGFELGDVVAARVAELEARAVPAPAAGKPDAGVLEAALSTLQSRDERLHALALADLRGLGDAAVEELCRLLDDPAGVDTRRVAAARGLGAIGSTRAREGLCAGLERGTPAWVRAQCAWQLGRAGPSASLPRMLLRLRYETDAETVVWLAEALAQHGNLAGLDGLRVLSTDAPTEELRRLAGDKLVELADARGYATGEDALAAWRSGAHERAHAPAEPPPELELEAWRWIARLAQWDLRQVDDARFVLSHLDGWIVPRLVAALHERDVYTRVHAAQALERMGPRAWAAFDELCATLAEPRAAPAAAAALGALGDRRAALPLAERLAGADDLELRSAAAAALGRLGEPSAREPLRRVFAGDEPRDLRQVAAQALVALGAGDEVAPFLLECLESGTDDPDTADAALGRWLQERGARGGESERRWQAWKALDPPSGTIESAPEVAARHRARAALVREGVRSQATFSPDAPRRR